MPNSKSSREPINKIETGYCSRSRWGDRWVNWEGTSQYRNERDHVNPEATVEAVPAFLQKCLAGQNLLPLLGWWATPESWRSFHVCIESDREQQYPCPEKQRTFVSKAESAGLFMTRKTNKEDCTYSNGLGPIRLRKREGKKGSCLLHDWEKDTYASLSLMMVECHTTAKDYGDWDPEPFAVTPEPPGVQTHLWQY